MCVLNDNVLVWTVPNNYTFLITKLIKTYACRGNVADVILLSVGSTEVVTREIGWLVAAKHQKLIEMKSLNVEN